MVVPTIHIKVNDVSLLILKLSIMFGTGTPAILPIGVRIQYIAAFAEKVMSYGASALHAYWGRADVGEFP